MKYCTECILPDSRPNLTIGSDGICNASTGRMKTNIDWDSRKGLFEDLCKKVKRNASQYDCIIPVSGGKDSTWQVLKALEFGLKPLCVTWRSPARTSLGQRNLDNLIGLGVDHIDFSINPVTEKKFMRKTFSDMGSPAIPMHMAIHSIPTNIALNWRIPLIIYGENSAFEYGGTVKLASDWKLTPEWFNKYGVTNGTHARDWSDEELTSGDLGQYQIPNFSLLEREKISAIFLGYFFNWDPIETSELALKNGFSKAEKAVVGIYDFADIDDAFIMSVHHWLKWFKFGFTRTWDNLSIEIRAGRVSRDQAIELIKSLGLEEPTEAIDLFCNYIEIDRNTFDNICEKFRNPEVWTKSSKNEWVIKDFLIDNWIW